ncbi:uncharacterized protein [Branchiostoma lanceolatum]|uniref:uncharacterized protein n=1 Tax=Branchiostoma lanceolatum TaxID=7740 RepID=UPI0034569EF6
MQTREACSCHRLSFAETINVTDIRGDGNITVSAGSGSTIIITTCSYDVPAPEEDSRALVPVVPKPVGKPQMLNTKTQKSCRKYIDNLAMLTSEGKILKCHSTIAKLMKTKADPDSQVSLRHAASLNAIYEGEFKKANRLLREVSAILPDTRNEAEHRLWWGNLKSVVKMREGNINMGIVFAKEALPLLEAVAPGCMTAWLLLNHALLLTEIAAGQDDDDDRHFLVQRAETDYCHAIEHAENDHSKQMLNSQLRLRVSPYAKIGLALLYLGCGISGDISRLAISDVPLDQIGKAKSVIAALDRDGTVCNSTKFWLMMVKTCLHYRQGSYQQAYELAQEAKVFASEHSFGGFLNYAKNTVDFRKERV